MLILVIKKEKTRAKGFIEKIGTYVVQYINEHRPF